MGETCAGPWYENKNYAQLIVLRRFALWILVRFNFAECYILWRLYPIVSRQKCGVAFAVVILSVRLFVSLSVTPAIKVKTAEHVVSFFYCFNQFL